VRWKAVFQYDVSVNGFDTAPRLSGPKATTHWLRGSGFVEMSELEKAIGDREKALSLGLDPDASRIQEDCHDG